MELNERILEAAILNELVRDKVPVTVTLINGTEFQGVVVRYDVLVVALATEGKQQIIYKHSIASITPQSTLKSAQPKS
jgi:host factor-I protein